MNNRKRLIEEQKVVEADFRKKVRVYSYHRWVEFLQWSHTYTYGFMFKRYKRFERSKSNVNFVYNCFSATTMHRYNCYSIITGFEDYGC